MVIRFNVRHHYGGFFIRKNVFPLWVDQLICQRFVTKRRMCGEKKADLRCVHKRTQKCDKHNEMFWQQTDYINKQCLDPLVK